MQRYSLPYRSRHLFRLPRSRMRAVGVRFVSTLTSQRLVERIIGRHAGRPRPLWEEGSVVPHAVMSPFPLVFRPAFVEPIEEVHGQEWVQDPALQTTPVEIAAVDAIDVGQAQSWVQAPSLQNVIHFLPEQHFVAENEDAPPVSEIDREERQDMSPVELLPTSTAPVPLQQQERQDMSPVELPPTSTAPVPLQQQEQEQTHTYEWPVEVRIAKRPRRHIEERREPGRQKAHSSEETERPVEQTSADEIPIDKLFAPREGIDRSPQAWLARLRGNSHIEEEQTQELSLQTPTQGSQVQSHRERTSPVPTKHSDFVGSRGASTTPTSRTNTPLSQQMRRFLQPLVGIDLSNIRVYRDTTAEHLADAYQADAVTMGNNVEVAAGHLDDTPETLGLLAHEFTHVARRREPTFIPPVARSRTNQSSSMSEEEVALRVEGRVRRSAQEQVGQMVPLSAELVPGLEGGPVPSSQTTRPLSIWGAQRAQAGSETEAESTMQDGDVIQDRGKPHPSWGGLPAPWEPLPDWLSETDPTPISPARGEYNTHIGAEAEELSLQAPTLAAGVQRAGRERTIERNDVGDSSVPASASNTPKNPEPDLDVLAQQVYSRLKRRLGVEERRAT